MAARCEWQTSREYPILAESRGAACSSLLLAIGGASNCKARLPRRAFPFAQALGESGRHVSARSSAFASLHLIRDWVRQRPLMIEDRAEIAPIHPGAA
jgi:hypothetical protein